MQQTVAAGAILKQARVQAVKNVNNELPYSVHEVLTRKRHVKCGKRRVP